MNKWWAIEDGGVRGASNFFVFLEVTEQCWTFGEGWGAAAMLVQGKNLEVDVGQGIWYNTNWYMQPSGPRNQCNCPLIFQQDSKLGVGLQGLLSSWSCVMCCGLSPAEYH